MLAADARAVIVQVLSKQPTRVTRDGAALPQVSTVGELEAAETGWRADASTGFVLVKFQHQGGSTRVARTA